MKLAPITPPGLEYLLPPETLRYFCFADIAIQRPDYLQWFIDALVEDPLAVDDHGKGIVLDNQIYEGLRPLSPALFGEMCQILEPALKTIILPDSRQGMVPTLKMAEEYLPHIPTTMHHLVAGVLQGSDFAELEQCAQTFTEQYMLEQLAIPVRVPGRPSRRAIYEELQLATYPVDFHFLGGDYPYLHEIQLAKTLGNNVVSMDTAEPFHATYNRVFMEQLGRDHVSTLLSRDPDFMNERERPDMKFRLWQNVRFLQDLLSTRIEDEWLQKLRGTHTDAN